ncbi:MAG: hypothetical protein GY927_19520 [bacterium]|nr:hypothetical protein [bacterium]
MSKTEQAKLLRPQTRPEMKRPQRSAGSAGGLFFEHEVSARRCILYASGKKLLTGGLFQTGKGLNSQQEKAGRQVVCANI